MLQYPRFTMNATAIVTNIAIGVNHAVARNNNSNLICFITNPIRLALAYSTKIIPKRFFNCLRAIDTSVANSLKSCSLHRFSGFSSIVAISFVLFCGMGCNNDLYRKQDRQGFLYGC